MKLYLAYLFTFNSLNFRFSRTVVVDGEEGMEVENEGKVAGPSGRSRTIPKLANPQGSGPDEFRTTVVNEGEEQGGEEGPSTMKALPAGSERTKDKVIFISFIFC